MQDIDPSETQEWLLALRDVVKYVGKDRAQFLIQELLNESRRAGISVPTGITTDYINTIDPSQEPKYPGDEEIEKRISAIIRWNAIAMVLHAGKKAPELGGHIASFASAETLYSVGFNHFFRGTTENNEGDLIYIQGHSSPGIYARAYLEGRLTKEQLDNFRQEVAGHGLSSYPHPRLMPEFWQFPTVSMGLGPLQAIYQARFLKYLENRGLAKTSGRKVWVFCGDGEMDEPESLGAISIAAREKLDNLIFVINCNLQRLDGPVRGNGKIIQELEGIFHGAGWHVLKVIWGRHWDELLAKDKNGILRKRMMEAVDGDYQNYRAKDGAYIREQFFGKYPELLELISDKTDDQIWHMRRGGHDPLKVYAAYAAAVQHKDQPVVILAKSIKGYGMGAAGEGMNFTHQQKKMDETSLKVFRDRFEVPITDQQIAEAQFYRPAEDSPEIKYLLERRHALGGFLPARRKQESKKLTIPSLETFTPLLQDTADREISTTMAFVRMLTILIKDKEIGKYVVPIVPDESRTFGMEGMFRQIGIYSPVGQLYTPVDVEQIMSYKEAKDGQILEEGINEAGSFCSWIAAGSSYSTNDLPMIPFYIYYSMFGFQRIGDLAWAAGDMQVRGFLLGGTSGRTTLAGEGLQHQDGHSHLQSATIPNCISYDPTYSYELAVIIHDGLRRMYQNNENVFYYITVLNENYNHPALPKGAEQGIIKGMYLLQESKKKKDHTTVQLLGCGAILREVIAAAELLANDFNVAADVWSVTSFTELRREALSLERQQLLNPTEKIPENYVMQCLKNTTGPIIAASDYMKSFADQIRAFVPRSYTVLGTDGFGRSDTRQQLRHFFEVNRYFIVIAALKALANENKIPAKKVAEAIKKYNIDPRKPEPVTI